MYNIYIYIYKCLTVHTSIYLSVYLSVCLSIYLSTYLAIYLSIYPSIHLSIIIYLSVYLSIYLSLCIYMCVCVYSFIIWAVYMVYYLNPLGLKASSPAILHRVAWSSSKSNPGAIQLWLSQVHWVSPRLNHFLGSELFMRFVMAEVGTSISSATSSFFPKISMKLGSWPQLNTDLWDHLWKHKLFLLISIPSSTCRTVTNRVMLDDREHGLLGMTWGRQRHLAAVDICIGLPAAACKQERGYPSCVSGAWDKV